MTMSSSEQAKAAGLKSLRHMSQLCDVSERTLLNWHKNNPRRFTVMLAGCVQVMKDETV